MIFALLLAAQLTKLPQLLDAPPAVYPPIALRAVRRRTWPARWTRRARW